ncbi:hypothetical protein BJY04DRAFT_189687 [Aspergillus karnatakaensis]|uniref:uncharacterized protein n=1 Tax=Aspergillus karnatakaensis TaxID=1810916 RepID=UPI003CCDB4D4
MSRFRAPFVLQLTFLLPRGNLEDLVCATMLHTSWSRPDFRRGYSVGCGSKKPLSSTRDYRIGSGVSLTRHIYISPGHFIPSAQRSPGRDLPVEQEEINKPTSSAGINKLTTTRPKVPSSNPHSTTSTDSRKTI